MKEDLIFHLVPKRNWEKWHRGSYYEPPVLEEEGSIPCSRGGQLNHTANHHFKGERRLMVLVIDIAMIEPEVTYKSVEVEGKTVEYPHIAGKLNIDSIIDKLRIYPNNEGQFDLEFRSEE